MYNFFKTSHHYLAYYALAFLLIAIIYSWIRFLQSKPFTNRSKIIAIIGMVGTHIQLLVGFILYFLSPLGFSNLSGETMKNTVARFYAVEHPLMMMIAFVLITLGYRKSKKFAESKAKFKRIGIFYTLGLLIILYMIPWNVWL
tara:strand:- start:29083 stop:29511 length:429 start_codon:yes stop_codon:yes gene_type:complete